MQIHVGIVIRVRFDEFMKKPFFAPDKEIFFVFQRTRQKLSEDSGDKMDKFSPLGIRHEFGVLQQFVKRLRQPFNFLFVRLVFQLGTDSHSRILRPEYFHVTEENINFLPRLQPPEIVVLVQEKFSWSQIPEEEESQSEFPLFRGEIQNEFRRVVPEDVRLFFQQKRFNPDGAVDAENFFALLDEFKSRVFAKFQKI